ncbi:MAG: hypothetical protein D6830_06795 [Ignavibacteria bacterium]|nr:MAG: hypothetical protein D6830_06795 [Ignavibacteria bacterium]
MTLTLYITKNCGTCNKVEADLKNIVSEFPELNYSIYDVAEKHPKNLVIVPALFLDDELYSYGEFDTSKLKFIISQNL